MQSESQLPISGPSQVEVSVVATVYRSAQLVDPLIEEIVAVMEKTGETFEIVLVDDRSPDDSWARIQTAAARDPRIRALRLRRNCGQQISASAALTQASGRYIVLMDGDLQNPTDAIPEMLRLIRQNVDIVYTVDNTRNNWLDGLTSWIFWQVLTTVCGVHMVKHQLMLRMMTRDIAQAYCGYSEHVRTVAGVLNDITASHAVLNVHNRKRTIGSTNYSLLRRLSLMLEIVISLTTAPLNILMGTSFAIFLLTIVAMFYYLAMYFIDDIQPGFTSIFLLVSFFGSLSLMMLGFIGRYLAVIALEVRRRPLYHIEDILVGK